MLKTVLPIAMLALAASPAAAAEIQIQSSGPVIELSVSQTVNAKPDTAILGAGVQTRAMTADGAARDNAVKMDAIIARIRALGVVKEDIQTSNFSINPQFQYNNDNTPPRFIGYDVSNMVTFKLRKLDKVGPALDALIASGANNINGPTFMLDNDTAARSAARRAAFADAQARARELAGLAGYAGVKLLEVSEAYANVRPMQMERDAVMVTGSSVHKATPIEPGQVGTAATLTVKYEMTR